MAKSSGKKSSKSAAESSEVRLAEPLQELSPFEQMERLFENFMMRPFRWPEPLWREWPAPAEWRQMPKVDVIERDDEFVVRAQIPGFSKEDIDISVAGNTVTIRGSIRHEEKEERGNFYRRECSYGSFVRTLPLPGEGASEKAKASFRDGVLELVIPKLNKSRRHNVKID